jgi:hypothetical protein
MRVLFNLKFLLYVALNHDEIVTRTPSVDENNNGKHRSATPIIIFSCFDVFQRNNLDLALHSTGTLKDLCFGLLALCSPYEKSISCTVWKPHPLPSPAALMYPKGKQSLSYMAPGLKYRSLSWKINLPWSNASGLSVLVISTRSA